MKYALLAVAAAAAAYGTLQLGCVVYLRLDRLAPANRSTDVEALLQDRALSLTLLVAVSLLACAALSWWLLPVFLIASFVLSRRMPAILAARRQRRLAQACDAQLDVLADIVGMGVGAGLSFDAALDMYCTKFDGELAEQMSLCRTLYRSGIATRSAALADAAAVIGSKGFRRFADTSTQAIERGAPLGRMLAGFADDVRRHRRAELEQRIAKAPVKMLVPTGLLILPAMLILVMGPAFLQFLGTGF